MRLYNYDYDDMRDISFSMDDNEPIQFHSQIYPTVLEVKIEEETNRPYLYYEGLVRTNKGCFKITFPKLDLVLNCIQNDSKSLDVWDRPWGMRTYPVVTEYETTTTFNNINETPVIFTLTHLSADEYKDIAEQVWKGITIQND